MDEYVLVQFDDDRIVILDGRAGGRTNRIMIVPGGLHTFSIDEPFDFEPESQRQDVAGTSPALPLRVPFRRRAAVA
jgi:hypothetical protein